VVATEGVDTSLSYPLTDAAIPEGDEVPPGEPRRIAYFYILPALCLYFSFVLLPLGHGAWLSFFDWDGLTSARWVGLQNYRELIGDPRIRSAFEHAFVLVVFFSILPVTLGLVIAGILSSSRVRGIGFFRTVLFLPQVIAMAVVAIVWRWMYASDGPINQTLETIGLGGLRRAWLGDFDLALPALGLVGTWVMYGLPMVLFIAGVQRIPTSLYDAAKVDGAGRVREFFAVTLPALRNEIVVALALTMITALRTFDLVYVTTNGGPGDSTSVPALALYRSAFLEGRVGFAAAIGVTLALIIFVVTFLITRLGEKYDR
jgi:raffinose/stachyose/melibiose transport system permease protein